MAGDVAKLILVPHERSHPFARRECVVTEPLKVGRSVDKRRISQNNLIFDCRVLSRNHALIWFKNGKFYIQDTKSSNGTFVNETRLSPSGEESGPVELKSRDIVQFGVNVNVEKKVTHGCIIGTIRLYINDEELPGLDPPIQQVMQIVQSALSREQELEHKLACMQEVLNASRQLANESMIAIVREDELMSRLEMLENQLQVYSKGSPEDELKKQLAKVFEEKHKSELTSKDSLRTLLQEKLECIAKLNQVQRDYDKAEQECQKYRTLYDASKEEHSEEVGKLSDQLRNMEKERKALEDQLTEEKQSLHAKLETLQAETNFTQQQLTTTKARLEETQDDLFQLKVKTEADKQRRVIGMESFSSTGESLELFDEEGEDSFKVLPDDPNKTSQTIATMVPTIVIEEFREEGLEAVPEPTTNAIPMLRAVLGYSSDSEDEEGEKEAARFLELEMRVVTLEEELRMSEETVHRLKEEFTHKSTSTAVSRGREKMEDVARVLSEVAIARGQVEVLQGSLSQMEEHIRHLQAELREETGRRHLLQDSLSVTGGQLNQCYAELEARHTVVVKLKGDLGRKENEILSLKEEVRRCQLESTASLKKQLLSLQQKFDKEVQQTERTMTENSELTSEVKRLELKLDESRRLQEEKEKAKPHFLVRPGSPTADDQRVKLLTIIALVSIGVALASWLT